MSEIRTLRPEARLNSGSDCTLFRFIALVAGVYALLVAIGLCAHVIDLMSWTLWFLPPQGVSRIDNAISAGRQVGGWIAGHAEYSPYLVHGLAALMFAMLAMRYAAGHPSAVIRWVLLGGCR